jgi:hypothetical protein
MSGTLAPRCLSAIINSWRPHNAALTPTREKLDCEKHMKTDSNIPAAGKAAIALCRVCGIPIPSSGFEFVHHRPGLPETGR